MDSPVCFREGGLRPLQECNGLAGCLQTAHLTPPPRRWPGPLADELEVVQPQETESTILPSTTVLEALEQILRRQRRGSQCSCLTRAEKIDMLENAFACSLKQNSICL